MRLVLPMTKSLEVEERSDRKQHVFFLHFLIPSFCFAQSLHAETVVTAVTCKILCKIKVSASYFYINEKMPNVKQKPKMWTLQFFVAIYYWYDTKLTDWPSKVRLIHHKTFVTGSKISLASTVKCDDSPFSGSVMVIFVYSLCTHQ